MSDETIFNIIGASIFFGFFLLLLFLAYLSVRKSFTGKSGKINSLTISNILYKYEYFRKLSNEQQIRFIKIINHFNRKISYFGEQGLVVTDEMRVIIGAGFARMSMGNNFKKLYFFHSIILYPKAYHDEARKLKHLGKTSPQGYIAFSWEDVLKSEADLHDGVNLALHELSHALVVDMMQAQYEYEFEYIMVRQIYFTGSKEKIAVENGKTPIFRRYAYSSPHEFFAVCVEIFFELPEKLINNHWKTYRNFCILFKQNPLLNEIGNISWNKILDYPHEPGNFSKIENTLNYGPFYFGFSKLSIEINHQESKFHIKGIWNKKTYILKHRDVLFAYNKHILATSSSPEKFHLVLYYFKNFEISSIKFTGATKETVQNIVDIFSPLGLTH